VKSAQGADADPDPGTAPALDVLGEVEVVACRETEVKPSARQGAATKPSTSV